MSNTLQVADKPTLDTVKTTVDSTATAVSTVSSDVTTVKNDVSALKAQGGFKSDGTDFYAYNPADSSWNKVNFGGGGGSPTLTIVNIDMEMTGGTITVTHESGEFTTTETMPDEASLEIEVPYLGEYTVDYYVSNVKKKSTAIEVTSANNFVVEMYVYVGTFPSLSWEEIGKMCDAYYNGKILDLSQYWSVGDTKSISMAAMSATGVGESHSVQTRDICIIDFAHDNLTTAISGTTKAAITLELVDCLNTAGYMNSTNTNKTGWTSSARRTWCNDIFYNALPSDLRSLVKPVDKLASAGNKSAIINIDSDKCWFPSEIEVFDIISYSKPGEGSQYSYYTTTANRIKKVNGSTYNWWLRSPYGSGSTSFVIGMSGGSANYTEASYGRGLAPAFCI